VSSFLTQEISSVKQRRLFARAEKLLYNFFQTLFASVGLRVERLNEVFEGMSVYLCSSCIRLIREFPVWPFRSSVGSAQRGSRARR
jgi:hypothetical protein